MRNELVFQTQVKLSLWARLCVLFGVELWVVSQITCHRDPGESRIKSEVTLGRAYVFK